MDAPYLVEQNEPLLTEKTDNSNSNSATLIIAMALDCFAPLPPFGNLFVNRMLLEPKVKMGLRFIKGPIISDTRIQLKCKNPEIEEYINDQLNRFMSRGMETALSSIERGYSGNETVLEKDSMKRYCFKRLNHLAYNQIEPQVLKGKVVSIRVKPEAVADPGDNDKPNSNVDAPIEEDKSAENVIQLSGVKKFWTVHNRDFNCVFGRSQLIGAHIPYHELCSMGGIREAVNLWFRKNAFDGGIIWAPDGYSKFQGVQVENRVIAQSALDSKRSGGTLVFPSGTDDKGNPIWRYEPPSSGEAPQTLLEWHDKLGDLIWEGMEVPPELSQGAEAGGSNNKRVIQTAFYTLCTSIATNIIHDFNEQILKPLVRVNFKKKFGEENIGYEIVKVTVINEMDYLNQQNQMGGLEDKKANNNPLNNGEQGPDVGKEDRTDESNQQDKKPNPFQKRA
jgi:hypothetical protein